MAEKATGFILDPATGEPAAIATVKFTTEDARILREYRKFLERWSLREAIYCSHCFENNLSHGIEAFVTNEKILFRCRCTMRIFDGPTY